MKQYPGYTLVKREECPEQHGTLTVLTMTSAGRLSCWWRTTTTTRPSA